MSSFTPTAPTSPQPSPDPARQVPPNSVAALSRGWRNKPKPNRRDIDISEINEMFKGQEDRYPPILSNAQAAELAGIKPQSLRKQLCAGRYADCVIRGNPVRFFRNKFVRALWIGRGQ